MLRGLGSFSTCFHHGIMTSKGLECGAAIVSLVLSREWGNDIQVITSNLNPGLINYGLSIGGCSPNSDNMILTLRVY